MAKRGANTYLTHDNWDNEEEESEEPGVFTAASHDVLEKREIKKAKRRGVAGTSTSGAGGAFQGFSFTGGSASGSATNGEPASLSTAGPKPFSFTVNPTKSVLQNSDSFGMTVSISSSSTSATASVSTTSMSTTKSTDDEAEPSEYRKNLRNLNESVLTWISEHIDRNPYCILTPIFADYEKYIAELDRDFPSCSNYNSADDDKKNNPASESTRLSPHPPTEPTPPKTQSETKFAFGSVSSAPATANTGTFNFLPSSSAASSNFSFAPTTSAASASLFNFGAKSAAPTATVPSTTGLGLFSSSTAPSTTSVFSTSTAMAATTSFGSGFFGAPKPADGSASGAPASLLGAFGSTGEGFKFTPSSGTGTSLFGTSSLFSSAGAMKVGEKQEGEGGDDEDYVPPKAEVVEVKEEGSFYSIRCKLFYMKGDKYQERGIGFLHLKSCGENGVKTQLLVRTDTTLGNILLNIMLNKSIPISRQGTNNLTMMCVPNPPLDEKKEGSKEPVLMLIRVKTKEDADELFKQLNDCKMKL